MSCGIVQSIIRQQRSQQAYSPLTCSWPFHTNSFYLFIYFISLPVVVLRERCACVCLCMSVSSVKEQGRSLSLQRWAQEGDRPGATSAEMSQMSRIHSCRAARGRRRLARGWAVRLRRVRSGDEEREPLPRPERLSVCEVIAFYRWNGANCHVGSEICS